MSIWKKPLWGKAKTDTSGLARPSAQRFAFLVADRGLRDLPWYNAIFLGAKLLTAIEMIAFAMLALNAGSGLSSLEMLAKLPEKFLENATASGIISATLEIGVSLGLVIFGVPAFLRWLQGRQLSGLTRQDAAAARRQRRKWTFARSFLLWGVLIVGFAVLGLVLAIATPIKSSAFLPLSWLCNFGGALLILLGWRNRSGSRIVCVRCEYPMNTWRGSAARCPECGSAWKERWRARLGERRVRWSWIGAGAALLALAPLITMLVLSGLRSR